MTSPWLTRIERDSPFAKTISLSLAWHPIHAADCVVDMEPAATGAIVWALWQLVQRTASPALSFLSSASWTARALSALSGWQSLQTRDSLTLNWSLFLKARSGWFWSENSRWQSVHRSERWTDWSKAFGST